MVGYAALAATFLAYALVAGRLDRWSITAPMVFVTVGAVLGPAGTGALDLSLTAHPVRVVAELTLALLLFADASTVALRDVEGDAALPTRLLFIGMPLTIVLGTVAAAGLLPASGWAVAALVSTILAPTDAALGLPMFTDRSVPVRVRRALNVESGLNDGLATPFVAVFLALAVAEETSHGTSWLAEAVGEIALAVVVALVVGWLGGRTLRAARDRGLTTEVSEQLAVLSLALLAFVAASAAGGNGFVSAFVAGLLFRVSTGASLEGATSFTERVGLFASFLVWAIFGAILVGPVIRSGWDASAAMYAVLSLTVLRMLPVAAALAGTGLRRATVAFMGWFGPRGLASVVFTLIAVETLGDDPATATIARVATTTILLSVFAHGLSAKPLAAAFARHSEAATRAHRELRHAAEPAVRRQL